MTKTWWNILGRRLFLYNNILIYILKQDFIKEFKSQQQTTTQQKEESKEIEKIEETIMAALILTDDGDRLLMLLRP